MLSLQLSINGKTLRTASTSGATSVSCIIDARGADMRELDPAAKPVVVRLGGIASDADGACLLTWLEGLGCAVGDEITIRVTECEPGEADKPAPQGLPESMGLARSDDSAPSWLRRLFKAWRAS